jgi:FSR family fosmidomycin resistance protein-like MFS transporter
MLSRHSIAVDSGILDRVSSSPAALDAEGRTRSTASDVRLITVVCVGHFLSHFYGLVLPPLFPLLRAEFVVSYAALGALITASAAASAISQPVSGFLVDRFGARRVLLVGLTLLASAVALAGVAPSYAVLVVVMAAAGLGNGVFHPADYSIFNAAVHPRRLGRAYSAHSSSGSLGWVLAPIVVGGLTAAFGWRIAVVAVGLAGVAVALILSRQRVLDEAVPVAPERSARARNVAGEVRLLLTPPILMAFAYFVLVAASMSAVSTFSVVALVAIYDAPLTLAAGALTAYMLGSAAGVVGGGLLADRMRRHAIFAAAGMAIAAALTVVLASGLPPTAALAALLALIGFAKGATNPSRDLLVRGATPAGASGRVFGFVYSGLDVGTLVMPPIYGWLIDRGEPRAIFLVAAALMALTMLTVLEVGRRGAAVRTPSS